MKAIFQNSLFTAGTKITVKDRTKHRAIAPGSICFMVRPGHETLPPNMISLELAITKNGKRGKDRVSRIDVITTVFPIEFEARPLKSDKYKRLPIVELESVPMDTASVVDMNPMDFIGWAYSYKRYLYNLHNNYGIAGKWPRGKAQSVNAFSHIGPRMQQSPTETIKTLSAPFFRPLFTEQLRALEASITQCILARRVDDARTRLKALAYLIWTEKKYKESFYNTDQLKENYNHYRTLLEDEQSLYHQISTKRWLSLPGGKRKTLPKPTKPNKPAKIEKVVAAVKAAIKNGKKLPYDSIVFPDDFGGVGIVKNLHTEMFEIQEA